MPRAAWIAAFVLLAVGVAGSFVPFLTQELPTLAGTPVPPPLPGRATTIPMKPTDYVCWDSLAISTDTDAVAFGVGTYFRPGQPLLLELNGPGLHERSRVPGGYRDNAVVEFDIPRPKREVLAGACVTNMGRRKVALYATSREHEAARPAASVSGVSTQHEPAFVLVEREETSLLSRIPDALDRAGLFAPLGWVTWPLFILALIAIPALALLALRESFRDRPDRP